MRATILLSTLLCGAISTAHAAEQELASYALDTTLKLSSDQRTRGTSDSLSQPSLKLTIQGAHESGLIALAEFDTVSKKQFLGGAGLGMLLAAGYRFGDPDEWHFGAGMAAELFPGAKFTAPHGFDLSTGELLAIRRSNFNSAFAVLEVGYGPIEGRILNVVSKTYRGANTGGVCGTMLGLMPDPTKALECYGRGDHGSRGTWLFDLGYKTSLAPATELSLHAGYQKVANFKEANLFDMSVGLTHAAWGFDWGVEWVGTRAPVRELYLVQDGAKFRATDQNKVVASVSKSF